MERGCVEDQPQHRNLLNALEIWNKLRLVEDDTAALRDFSNRLLACGCGAAAEKVLALERLGWGLMVNVITDFAPTHERPAGTSEPIKSKVKVWLVDDDDQLRTLVGELLGLENDIECVRQFSSPDELLSALASKPRVFRFEALMN